MNISRWAINNKNTVVIFSFLVILGGISSYFQMGKLRNPSVTFATAVVLTEYPGASAREVELLVTEPLEKAVEAMGTVEHVRSMSQPGLSTVFVDLKDSLPQEDIPQSWNELRERVNDAQYLMPQGAVPSLVVDHFSRTYGVFLALTGKGFSMSELRIYAETLQKELRHCTDVAGVALFGIQDEQIEVILSRERLATLGVNPDAVYQALSAQNTVVPFGELAAGDRRLRVSPTGNFTRTADIRNLLVGSGPGGTTVRLGDLAEIRRAYVDPPEVLFRFNGEPAVGIGVSTIAHGNVVALGESVKKKLAETTAKMPAGLNVSIVNFQSDMVLRTINVFITSLILAVVIVLGILLVTLGYRSAVVITNGLIVNICGTLLVMYWMGIDLQCVSISSLIIVLGMLVDDSVVVTDNVMVRLRDGKLSTSDACIGAARATGWPQLVATFVAIASFLPIDLAKSSTGEFCKTLFDVVAIALAISWIQAMTVVPVMSAWVLKPNPKEAGSKPYTSRFYKIYLRILDTGLRHRLVSVIVTVLLFGAAMGGFGYMKQVFFGSAGRPQYVVDYWLPEGTRIEQTSADMARLEKEILSWPEIEAVTSTVGSGPLRFMLSFIPQQPDTGYGNLIVNTRNPECVPDVVERTRKFIHENLPQATSMVGMFTLYGAPMYNIAARISGDDPVVLRRLADQAESIMRGHPMTMDICNDWRNQTPVWKPEFLQAAGAARGVGRQDISWATQWLTSGAALGTFYEGNRTLPILLRVPEQERLDTPDLCDEPLWGQGSQESIPLCSVLGRGEVVMENAIIQRYDRVPTITVQCNPRDGITTADLRNQLAERFKAIAFPPGYTLVWGGMYEQQNESNNSVNAQFPLSLVLMIGAVILLFNGVRGPLIILLTLPLSIIGIVIAFLVSGMGFGFMALLGMYGLIGMMIRNAVILIGEMDLMTKDGGDRFQGVVKASLTRVRPVLITAFCTTFGMIPLLTNDDFQGMALTIMGGLLFATVLTLVFIPVLYALFYRIRPSRGEGA
ncbi:MAG: efflux RND transporter permease subunit [Thermodesulfobacteriota bacterium]